MSFINNLNEKYLFNSRAATPDLSENSVDIFNVKQKGKNINFLLKIPTNHNFLLNFSKIEILSNLNMEFLQLPVDFGIISREPNQKKDFGIVFNPVPQLSLSMLINQGHHFSEKTIFESILKPIANTLKILHSYDIIHGSLNADNIFIANNGKIILKECVTSPCGSAQKSSYRKLLSTNFKGITASLRDDFHALGVLCIELILGTKVYHTTTKNRLINGDYHDLVKDDIISGTLNNIIKHLLQENAFKELNLQDLKIYDTPTCKNANKISNNPVFLNGVTFINLKEYILKFYHTTKIKNIAIIIYELKNKIQLPSAVKLSLEKFLDQCLQSKEIKNIDSHKEIILATFIKIITNDSFYKLNQFCIAFTPYAISQLLHEICLNFQSKEVQAFRNFIKFHLILKDKNCEIIFNKYKSFFVNPLDNNFRHILTYILYDLNPLLYFRSNDHIFSSLKNLVLFINTPNINSTEIINDPKLVGYMISKLKYLHILHHESYVKHFSSTDLDFIKVLQLFANAQKRYEIFDLKHLTRILINNLIEKIIPNFSCKQIQNTIRKDLLTIADDGNIQAAVNIVIGKDIWDKDRAYMEKSLEKISQINNKLTALQNIESQAHILSMNYTMLVSYLIFIFIMLYIFYRLYI